MFYLFFVICTGGTKPTWKNEQNRSSSLGPRKLNHMDILMDVFTSGVFSRFLLIAVWILFFNLLIYFQTKHCLKMGWCIFVSPSLATKGSAFVYWCLNLVCFGSHGDR